MSQEISSSKLQLTSFAARQWRDYQQRTPGSAFADPALSMTLEEAYAVQMETARLRCAAGDEVAGYKVGCIGAGVVEQFGMSGPIHARLFRSEIRQTGEILRYESFVNPAIEGEMALRVGDDGQIATAFPIIELHHFVFRAPRKTLAELVSNNGINAGIVIANALETTPLESWATARAGGCDQRQCHRYWTVMGNGGRAGRIVRLVARRSQALW